MELDQLRTTEENYFDLLSDELVLNIADKLYKKSPKPFLDKCKPFYRVAEIFLEKRKIMISSYDLQF